MLARVIALTLIVSTTTAEAAGNMDAWLRKLDLEERARQACMLRGLNEVSRDARLRKADRMKSGILANTERAGTHIAAKGGAVRANGHWYALAFECNLTADFMKANDFVFTLGDEIPKAKWETLGLW